jgi:hypothetical protein
MKNIINSDNRSRSSKEKALNVVQTILLKTTKEMDKEKFKNIKKTKIGILSDFL